MRGQDILSCVRGGNLAIFSAIRHGPFISVALERMTTTWWLPGPRAANAASAAPVRTHSPALPGDGARLSAVPVNLRPAEAIGHRLQLRATQRLRLKDRLAEVIDMLRAIHAQESRGAAKQERSSTICESSKMRKAVDIVEQP
jgi:hypothetical protein